MERLKAMKRVVEAQLRGGVVTPPKVPGLMREIGEVIEGVIFEVERLERRIKRLEGR